MAWPTTIGFDDSVLDATSDSVYLARPELYALMQDVADMIEARAAADGVASLGNDGLIPTAQLPVVPISKGGTGATNAQQARANLGLTPYDGTTPESAGPFTISHPSTMELLTLESTADNTSGIVMSVNRLRPAGANDDVAFVLGVQANDEAGGTALVSTISTSLADASEAAMTSRIAMQTMQAGTLADRMLIDGDTVRVLGKLAGGSSGAAGSPASNELLWGGNINVTGNVIAGTSKGLLGLVSGYPGIWFGTHAAGPTTSNYAFLLNEANVVTTLNTPTSGHLDLRIGNDSADRVVFSGKRLGIGFGSSSGAPNPSIGAKVHVLSTTEQLRLGYNASNYAKHTILSDGEYQIVTEGTDPDLTIGTENMASAIFINDSSASILFTATVEVAFNTATIYQYIDAFNNVLRELAADGAVTDTLTGTDADYTLSTPNLPSAIFIDDSAGLIQLNGQLQVVRSSLGQPVFDSLTGTAKNQVFTISRETTDATPVDIIIAATISHGTRYKITVDVGYADEGDPTPANYGSIVRTFLIGRTSGGSGALKSGDINVDKTGDSAIDVTVTCDASHNIVVRLTGKAGTDIHFLGDAELVKE